MYKDHHIRTIEKIRIKHPVTSSKTAAVTGAFIIFVLSAFLQISDLGLIPHLTSSRLLNTVIALSISLILAIGFYKFLYRNLQKKRVRTNNEMRENVNAEQERKITEAKERGDFHMWDK